MKWFTLMCALFAYTNLSAVTIDVPRLSLSGFSDGESSADYQITGKPIPKELRIFTLSLNIANAADTNQLAVIFGDDDRHVDQKLSFSELDIEVGWNAGSWTLRERGLKKTYTYTPPPKQGASRKLLMEVRLTSNGGVSSLKFQSDGEPFEFSKLDLCHLSECYKPTWSMMRVISRGGAESGDAISASFTRCGAVIILR